MARVLETLGELARVSGLGLRPHVPEILPLVIDALNDASNSKKAVAITTLGQVPPPPLEVHQSPSLAVPHVWDGRDQTLQRRPPSTRAEAARRPCALPLNAWRIPSAVLCLLCARVVVVGLALCAILTVLPSCSWQCLRLGLEQASSE